MENYFIQANPNTIYAERYGYADYTIIIEKDEKDTYYVVFDETGWELDCYDTLEEAKQAVLNAWENEESPLDFNEPDNIWSLGLINLF